MSEVTLGLDLGTNSIGWALVDEEKQKIVATGVRVFPEGVDRDQQGGERSKNENRRTKRGTRRQINRRARRKKQLRQLLQDSGLLPLDSDRLEIELNKDPYELRRKALDGPVSHHEFGRIILHLNQRRGFQSNRKTDRGKADETSKMLQAISELQADIEAADKRTLGEHLAYLHDDPHHRIRGKHTRRDMLRHEFDTIWREQAKHRPDALTDELLERICDIIFFQRDVYWLKSTIGRCELEKGEKRCPRADRLAQKFRMWQEINNLRFIDTGTGEERALMDDERFKLYEALSKRKEMTFDKIRTLLELFNSCRFNLERGERSKLKGNETDDILRSKKYLGKTWTGFPEGDKDAIVELLVDANSDEEFAVSAREKWNLNDETIETLLNASTKFPESYVRFSRKAIEKLLPHITAGLPLMGPDHSPSAFREAGYLRPDQRAGKRMSLLPNPPEGITNPIVRQALFEVRKVVNAIIKEYGRPTRIHIELAREVKGNAEQRKEYTKQMKDRERSRENAKVKIEEHGIKATRDAIERYLLWEEQGGICVYTGKSIGINQLFGGEVDIDHILPRSRSLDDSLGNKVLCFRKANAEKGDRTPYEWLAESDPDRYEQICVCIDKRNLPYSKRLRFHQKSVELEEFINRQLTDTTYISRQVSDYVRALGVDVVCTKGQKTSDLRHFWGLDSILRDDGFQIKNRDDHRHHAVDAIVVALTNRSRLQQLARYHRDFPEPWLNFRDAVYEKVNAILVSHRVKRKTRGALHEETNYGPTKNPGVYVVRKNVEALTLNAVTDIRDETIKQIVIERLREYGLEPGRGSGGNIPKAVWEKPLLMPSGVPIKKVRITKSDETIRPIRDGSVFVKPGNVHHLCLFEMPTVNGKLGKDAVFIDLFEAVRRTRQNEPIVQRIHPECPEARYLMSLSSGELVLLEHEGKESLFRFITAASTTKQMVFRHHVFAGKSSVTTGKTTRTPSTFAGRKVTVDPLGRLRWAND